MTALPDRLEVYLEAGRKRTFAGAPAWPGWCRGGRDEAAALQALLDYGPRYARALGPVFDVPIPTTVSGLAVMERLEGDSTTDFGAPGQSPALDARPADAAEQQRLEAILTACWQAFDLALQATAGRTLRRGPRGGGRDPEGIVRHLLDSDRGYLTRLGGKVKLDPALDPAGQLAQTRTAVLAALAAAWRGELAPRGPRGGRRWTPRQFVRRTAWHALDHAWEMEERLA